MTPQEDRAFYTKLAAGVFCLALFVASSLTVPPLLIDGVLRGALLAGGLGALGLNLAALPARSDASKRAALTADAGAARRSDAARRAAATRATRRAAKKPEQPPLAL